MNINIVCVGRLKEDYWRDACAEYAKRCGAYVNFKVIEVAEAGFRTSPVRRRYPYRSTLKPSLCSPISTSVRPLT